MSYRSTFAVAMIALVLNAPASHAGIVDTTGDMVFVSQPPLDLNSGAFRSDTQITAFAERQNVILPRKLTFNITQPGTSPGVVDINTSPGDLLAGTTVDSYFVHFESISGTRPNPVLASGSITFDTDVLGIAIYNRRLDESDLILGLPSILYPTSIDRELEIVAGGVVGVVGNDRITLSADRRTVTFQLGNAPGLDQARIVTAVPEPSTLAMVAVVMGCGLPWLLCSRRRSDWLNYLLCK